MPKTCGVGTSSCSWEAPWLEKVLNAVLLLGLDRSHGLICCCPGKSQCLWGLIFPCADVPLHLIWKAGFILE